MTTYDLCEQMRKVYHGKHDKKKAESGSSETPEGGEEEDKLRKRR